MPDPLRPGWLTLAQYAKVICALVGRRADRFNGTPSHFHYGSDCGAGRLYVDRLCDGRPSAGNVEDECRRCKEALYLRSRETAETSCRPATYTTLPPLACSSAL